jgi:hypothetical protein
MGEMAAHFHGLGSRKLAIAQGQQQKIVGVVGAASTHWPPF